MKSILVLRGGALGDFLLTLPLLHALRRAWPGARIELIGNPTAAELGIRAGVIDAGHSQHAARWLGFYLEELPDPLRAWVAGFDLVVNAWPDAEGCLQKHLPVRAGQRVLGIPAIREKSGPAWRQLLQPFEQAFGLSGHGVGPLPQLTCDPADVDEARRKLGIEPGRPGPLALHPGSGSPRKNAPIDQWRGLMEALRPRRLIVVLGEAEAALAPVFRPRPDLHLQVVQGWPLPLLAGALRLCQGLVGHDTGVSHLAGCVGINALALFGPTDPETWRPQAPQVEVLRPFHDRVEIPITEVIQRIQSWSRG